ncbi:DEAD/DEAH box helicase [Microlunatus ginsengisoli]|uniref:DEAD/DEAH box helicase n=1 Tax=Microlunatus ginsengisoli TaxID=363863 RepID=A0ABP6ZNN5_9ACTN
MDGRSADLTSVLANEAIIAMAGPEAFARAQVYVRDGHVGGLEFDADRRIVAGRVKGSHHASYATSVQLAGGPSRLPAHRGRCSCPIGVDCKHAAAILIAARGLTAITSQLGRPEWERSLGRLAAAAEPVREPEDVRLGLEFDLEQTPDYRGVTGQLRLRVRPVRRGNSGRWVRSGVGWEQLDYLASGYRSEQRDLLLQLWASAGAAARFAYPRSPWLDLSAISPSLWSVLERSGPAGLGLVTAAGTEELLVESREVAVGLDARQVADGEIELHPVVLRAGEPVPTGRIGVLGEPAHGVFWLDRPTDRSRPALVLAPLGRPLVGELRILLGRGGEIRVPAADRERFLREVVPTIRHAATLVSSDGSVGLPEPVRPRLVCAVGYRPEHRLRLDWSFVYDDPADGPSEHDIDQPIVPPSRRDRTAELALLDTPDLPLDKIPALRAPQGGGPAAHALLAGRDTVLFATAVLPRLAAAGVEIRTSGEPVDYRRARGAPLIEVSTSERPVPVGAPRTPGADWFDLHITVRVDGDPLDFEQLFVALSLGDEFMITEDGVCIDLERREFSTLRGLIDEARTLHEDDDEPGLRISPAQASVWDELLQLGVVVGQADRWSRAVRGLLSADPVDRPTLPVGLKAELRPYQLEGFGWLAARFRHGLGGILADDMGLGKTLQTLALICHAREQNPDEPPFLVVAPTSVTGNWVSEAARFAPDLRVVALEGSSARRSKALARLDERTADLVVTSYALARLDVVDLAARGWRGLILDEAQFVKNHRSKTYQAVRQVDAPYKVAITGTPLENNLMELWSLLSITAPGLFPYPERFSESYRLPIERGQDLDALDRLRRRIRPLMLRRTKEAVATELPPKQEQVIDVTLAPRHQRVYQTYLQRERQKVLGLVDELDKNRFTILRSITLLRQLALDPSLVDAQHTGVPASKIDLLVDRLGELVAEGHRALVFSQFTGFLGKIRERLEATGISLSYLDGSTRDRQGAIETFTGGSASVFLISLKAGGFGLNLTQADYCFVLDPWWNPAAEAQAVDRAHRIGQTRPVMVYRLVARDTIEEKVMALKARKEQLVGSVLADDVLGDSSLSADEIRELLAC